MDTATKWKFAMLTQHLSQRTIDERLRLLRHVSEATGKQPEVLNADDVAKWLASKKAVRTQQAYFSHLNAYFKFLIRHDLRGDNPMDRLSPPKSVKGVPRPIHREELLKVLSYSRLSQMTRDRIILGAYAGLRVHEIAKIDGKDIDLIANSLHVTGKGGRSDIIPLHKLILDMAHRYPRSGLWFPSPVYPNKPISARTITTSISHAFTQVGINATAHQLRHFYGTELLANGTDVRVVQTLMRHENLSTTAIYTRVSVEQQRAALDRLPTLSNRMRYS